MAISSWLGTSLSDVRRRLVPIRRHRAGWTAAFITFFHGSVRIQEMVLIVFNDFPQPTALSIAGT
jgi:hypothetical protein